MVRISLRVCLIFMILLCFISCATTLTAGNLERPSFTITAEPWPEADRLFRSDDHWLGGDGASTVDLGKGRLLWLFGDSFIDQGSSSDRRDAVIVRNSIAIQTGYEPSTASVKFYWHKDDSDEPASFFAEGENHWYWPGDGIRIDDRLVIFLMEISRSDNELSFDATGWEAVVIDNPDADPQEWNLRWIDTPDNEFGIIVGSACVISEGGYLYAFSVCAKNRDVYIIRWPISSVLKGDLSRPQWWTQEKRWVSQYDLRGIPPPLFSKGQMEFAVDYVPAIGKYLQIQTVSFHNPLLSFRWSENITGPWSPAHEFCRPVEAGQSGVLIYAGKLHSALAGADITMTYAVNSIDSERLMGDMNMYYPVFLRGSISKEEEE